MFKSGDLVRHSTKPEWGVGRVTGQTSEGKVLIKFTGRPGDVLLTAAGAEQHLTPDAGAVWAPPPRASRAAPKPVTRTPCVHCAAELRDVVTSPDGEWRSCPECSTRHGRQHVYLPFPGEFEHIAAAAAAAGGEPDPRALWCRSCRAGQRSSGFRLCKVANR